MNAPIDLRSDTVTRPSPAMRRAMAEADVGDDVFGEDPTGRALEEHVAHLLGKEAALFVPSGTMANQISIMVLTKRGDEVIVGEGAHCAFYESGAGAAIGGVQFVSVGSGGLFHADDVDAATKPVADWYPRTSVVAMENTHNRGGGRVFPQRDVEAIAVRARARGLALHLDGARLWNASVAAPDSRRRHWRRRSTRCRSVSKGLGAPVGSLIASTRERIAAARRTRKMLGGGMRQMGVLAAAGLYALRNNVSRLAEDHAHARRLFDRIDPLLGGRLTTPETNIVMIDLPDGTPADGFAARARDAGVLLSVFGPQRLRAVLHLDVDAAAISRAADTLAALLAP